MNANIGPILRALRHSRTRVVLIVLEIAMTLAIVTNCVNVILSERAKMLRPSGFDDDNIVWMRARPFSTEYRDSLFLGQTIGSDLRAIESVPGVQAVANTNFQLWEGGGSSTGIKEAGSTAEEVGSQIYYGTEHLLETLGARLTEGRGFREEDYARRGQPEPVDVTVISRSLAEDLFPGESALGKQIEEDRDQPCTVVGVIETFYNPWGIGGREEGYSDRVAFFPGAVGSYERGISYLIRTEPGAMSSVVQEVERRLTELQPDRVFDFKPTSEKKSAWFASSTIVVTTMTCIIVALVAVTALGILGLTSLAVAERTRQIGTRRALGATRAAILLHFVLENWMLTTAGLVLGAIGAYALNFLLVSQVSDVKMSWQLVAAGMVLLWGSGLLSTLLPASRAARIPPSIATRTV